VNPEFDRNVGIPMQTRVQMASHQPTGSERILTFELTVFVHIGVFLRFLSRSEKI
jgi:hypothetical protein